MSHRTSSEEAPAALEDSRADETAGPQPADLAARPGSAGAARSQAPGNAAPGTRDTAGLRDTGDVALAANRLIGAARRHFPDGSKEALAAEDLLQRAVARSMQAARPAELERGLRAALALADMRLDPATLAATLLVAVNVAPGHGSEGLGAEVAALAEGASRLARLRWDRLEEERVETLRKMFLAMARDVRVVLIVLALRLERMLEVSDASGEEARRLARETLAVHAPLASRLGIWQFKGQLEDAAFVVLEPEAYAQLVASLAETEEQRHTFIARVVAELRERLSVEQIAAEVSGRSKHKYSIHRKMLAKELSFEQVHDISAVRVITSRVQDCYAALGVVHALWAPVPHEFDDYIAMPKSNGYQSLHTAVVGPDGRVVEVQIRTREMHRYAEFGVAAHWAYKEGRKATRAASDRFMLLRQLLDWESDVVDPAHLRDSLETDIFADQVFVFTPQGDVVDLPQGSTPVDFAYRIHTEVGHRCRGARVNDQIVPLDYQLRTGDRVEILTHKLPRPSRDWMNPALGYLKTAAARNKVRHWFREQGRPEAIAEGREIVGKELSRLDLSRVSLEELARELGHESVEELYASVGYGDRRPANVTSAALQLEGRTGPSAPLAVPLGPPRAEPPPRGIVIDDVEDVQGRRAHCCAPLPGDDVVGFVTRGRGLVIHRRGCPQLRGVQEPERIVEVKWGAEPSERHGVEIEVTVAGREGVLGDVLKLVSNQGAHISSVEAHSTRGGDTSLRLSLDCRDAAHVAQVLERLAHHAEVVALRRVGH